jgi:hypothetical protein
MLADIKLSLSARRHIQLLHEHRGFYCLSCSPSQLVGACGLTCPLLSPHSAGSGFHGLADSETWQRRSLSDTAKYREITNDMDARGDSLYASTVARWERSVEKLNRGCMAPTEWHDREGWREMTPRNRVKVSFKEGWSFESAWGEGERREESVAPEVRLGGGKRRWDCANADYQDDRRKRVKGF